MCGRFTLTNPRRLVEAGFGELAVADGEVPARFNIAPSQPVLVLPNREPRALDAFRWGLIPYWAKDERIGAKLINARAETVSEKPAFRRAFAKRRCLVPADGFFEWEKKHGRGKKTPIYIRRRDGQLFAFAGLWEVWRPKGRDPVHSCTIITTEPNALVAPIHDRMPAMLLPEDYERWLDPDPQTDDGLTELLRPYPAELLEAYAVDPQVNSPQLDAPECIEPVAHTSRTPEQQKLF